MAEHAASLSLSNEHGLKKMQRSISSLEIQAPDPPFWTRTSWLQLGYGVWVNMTVMGIGLAFGFSAVTIPQLRDENSLIKISLNEEAWIASVITLSSPIGCILCGVLMDKYGRKLVLVLCEIPMFFGWFYIGLATTAADIIIGRVIAGVGLGMAITAPRAYITEITLPNMRGVIGALPNLFVSFGLTIQAVLGSFLMWKTLCYICGCYSVIIMICNTFLPDTPYFLLLKASGSRQALHARSNLRRFRSEKFNVEAELKTLYDFRDENNIRSLPFKDQIKALWRPSSCKPYGIASIYILISQLAGVNVIITYSVEMLESAKTSINANLGNFLLGMSRIGFGLVASVLLFKVGRRVMAMLSAIGVGLVCIGMCVFLYMNNEKSIVPVLLYTAYIAFATLGYYTLPFLIMFELIPLQLRGLLSGICISQLNLMMFAMNKSYPYIRQKIGLAYTMGGFGVFSLLGALILYFILPETKGLTLQEIEEFFNSRRSTLVSERKVMFNQLNELSRMSIGRSSINTRRLSEKEKKHKDSQSKTYDKKNPNNQKHKTNELNTKQQKLNEPVQENDKDFTKNIEKAHNSQDLKDSVVKHTANQNVSKENEDDFIDKKDKEKDSKEEDLQIEEKDLVDNKNALKDETGENSLKNVVKDLEENNLKDKEIILKDKTIHLKDEEKDVEEVDLKDEQNNLGLTDKENNLKDAETGLEDTKSINSKESKDSKSSKDKSLGKGAILFKNKDD